MKSMSQRYAVAGIEPRLEELMADPIVHLLMRRDRIRSEHVWAAVSLARRRLTRAESRFAGAGPAIRKSA
jgi:hypothetical protein